VPSKLGVTRSKINQGWHRASPFYMLSNIMAHSLTAKKIKRRLLRRTLGLGMTATALPSVWINPFVNVVVLPVHAQVSPVCPMLLIANVRFRLVVEQIDIGGGVLVPLVKCGVTFDVLSNDPTISLTITSLESDVEEPDEVNLLDDLGEVTATDGLTVTWIGLFDDSACLIDADPIKDVAFTITAECEADPSEEIVLEFNLSDLDGVTIADAG